MKIGFNEGCDRYCQGHSVMKDLELCERYGFDYIDIQSECLDRDLAAGKTTLEALGTWFETHHLKMLSYNALCGFNMKATQGESRQVLDQLDEIIYRCGILHCDTIVVVPSMDLQTDATRAQIRKDAVEVLQAALEHCRPHKIRLSLEFCGAPAMSINRFEDAYAIVNDVGADDLGITLDQYHFHAMASGWDALEKADGRKIFIWHLNDMEDLPCGAPYNDDTKRLWPGEAAGCLDHQRYARALKQNGFMGDVCTVEVFRPEYYRLTQEENIRKAAEVVKKHVALYWENAV